MENYTITLGYVPVRVNVKSKCEKSQKYFIRPR